MGCDGVGGGKDMSWVPERGGRAKRVPCKPGEREGVLSKGMHKVPEGGLPGPWLRQPAAQWGVLVG
jgi:hypothetical protein